jgi:hypothetical protein
LTFIYTGDAPPDAFSSELPDIDVEQDLKNIREKDKEIDKDIEGLGVGVGRLRDIAIDMGQVVILLIAGARQATGGFGSY